MVVFIKIQNEDFFIFDYLFTILRFKRSRNSINQINEFKYERELLQVKKDLKKLMRSKRIHKMIKDIGP